MSGKVILVGAGAGDAGLLTRRGEQVLKQAEVVVYDRLVGAQILAMIPEKAERIDVGKQPTRHPVPQWRINEILLEKAQEGKTVVRLKGGDPFLFGRGGEELQLLVEHGIPFEVVSGVTSALSAPAFAGIPVTHRDFASSLHIVTGHARAGKALDINFSALVESKGTLLFLMGISSLEQICDGLLNAGMSPDMPAAVVERGTLPQQRKVIATLATLYSAVQKEGLSNPAVIVVGKVVTLSEQFDWFSKRPLFGKRVVVTRPKERMGTLAESLRELGAEVLEYPCIETVAREENEPLNCALKELSQFEWLVFTSIAGVEVFFHTLWKEKKDIRALGGIKIAAIGMGTAKELEKWHLRADYIPEVYDVEHLAEGVAERATGAVLVPRSAIGSAELNRIFAAHHILYTDIATYDTVYRSEASETLLQWLSEDKPLAVTFTSGSTVRGFVASLPKGADISKVRGMSIGVKTAEVCAEHGMVAHIAEQATILSLIRLIESRA